MSKKIALANHVIYNTTLSDYAMFDYVAIQLLCRCYKTEKLHISPQHLYYTLSNHTDPTVYAINRLKNGINELEQQKIGLKIIEYTQKHYLLDIDASFLEMTEDYTLVPLDSILQIWQLPNINCYSLMRYYIILISTISNSFGYMPNPYMCHTGTVGCMTLQQLSELAGQTPVSTIAYNHVLEENDLIYIHHNANTFKDNRQLPNCYGLPENKEAIDNYANILKK